MLAAVLRLTGLDKAQKAFERRFDEKAQEALDDVKGFVVRMAVVSALAVATATFALLALITGLWGLYESMEPTYGLFLTLSIVGGVLAVIALVLMSAAIIVGRGGAGSAKVAPTPTEPILSPPHAASVATAEDMTEPVLSLVKSYARVPCTGSAPVDDFIRQMEPRVELVTKEVVTGAATLVQTGDRATMLAVLGAAMAFGWLLVKITKPPVNSNR